MRRRWNRARAGRTELTPEYIAESGFDWHVFPNTAFLHPAIEAVLWYRFRPCGDDHEKCLFDVWSFERFAPGTEPKVEHQHFDDWRDGDFPLIFRQDFLNIPSVQKGMKSRGFKASRTSPVQERAVSHFAPHLAPLPRRSACRRRAGAGGDGGDAGGG